MNSKPQAIQQRLLTNIPLMCHDSMSYTFKATRNKSWNLHLFYLVKGNNSTYIEQIHKQSQRA
jgi:hypothetical protein